MKQFFLIIALVSFSLHAQQNNLEVTHKVNDDKTVTFSYRKYVPGSYHVSLNFKRIDNASDPRFSNSVSGSSGTLFTLRPISSNKGIGFQYNYSYIRGKLNPKVDTDYVYRIPLANQKKVMVKNLNYLGEKYGNVEPKNWTAFQFIASTNDTVFAARKGIVVKVVNEYAANTNQSISYSSNEN